MSDVFVCYATADRQHARKLVEALRAEGFDVWWDDQMIPGETVDDRVKTQLDLAKAVVVIWSPYASAEELVRDLAERARDSDKLISTVVEGYDRTIIPAGLRRRHWVHLDEHDKILGALDRLAIGRTQPKRVPDVLISYSHTERSLAETLAQSLRAQGIDVWWDDSLVSGEDYGARINERLDSAKAVIVIWSPASVKSDWVRDEAERALTANKLVSVVIDGHGREILPIGPGIRHFVNLGEFDKILKALERLGIRTSRAPSSGPREATQFPRGATVVPQAATTAPNPPSTAATEEKPGPGRGRGLAGHGLAAGLIGALGIAVAAYAWWTAALDRTRTLTPTGPTIVETAPANSGSHVLAPVKPNPMSSEIPSASPPPTLAPLPPATTTSPPIASSKPSPPTCDKFPLQKMVVDEIGVVSLTLGTSCGTPSMLQIDYANLHFVRPLHETNAGLAAEFNLFAGQSELVLSIDGAPPLRQIVASKDPPGSLERAAIVWEGPTDLELRMAEFGVRPEAESDRNVSPRNPHSGGQARGGETGWMISSDDASGPGAHLQVYGFLVTGHSPARGSILAYVGLGLRGGSPNRSDCDDNGRIVPFSIYRMGREGVRGPVQLGYPLPRCNEISKSRFIKQSDGDIRIRTTN